MLLTENGTQRVTVGDLETIPTPQGTSSWKPMPHAKVLDMVTTNVERLGYQIGKMDLAVGHAGKRFFGVIDLKSEILDGVNLSLGVRNAHDKSISLGMCLGTRVMVCSNLAFEGEVTVFRKHTSRIEDDVNERITEAARSLHQYQQASAERIGRMQRSVIQNEQADSIILRAWEKGFIKTGILPKVVQEWRDPSHEEFEARTRWSLLNAYTEVMKDRQLAQPIAAANETRQFSNFLVA